jgi:hypothetical protein
VVGSRRDDAELELGYKPDWLEYTAAPTLWAPATLQDLLEDAEHEKRTALKSVEAVERYVERVVVEAAA